ncbi:MAG: universal stress protein [Gammaproteobacteria bacterium]|nr:MAG: universal stress protein [Gammaproteobacteria bacterium]
MAPMKRIVAATDLSSHAARAETRAAMLARELDCESLDLLHVLAAAPLEMLRRLLMESSGEMERRLMDSAREQLADIGRRLTGEHRIPPVNSCVKTGRPHAEISAYADAVDAGLVVVGAHGGGYVRELLLGATAEKVLRKISRPLLIVKREPQGAYRRALAPVDFSGPSRPAAMMALHIAPQAHITLVHAFEAPFEGNMHFAGVSEDVIHAYRARAREAANQEMHKLVSGCGAEQNRVSHSVEHGYPPSVILEKAEQIRPDLIVMGKHGQSGWEDALLGSVTKHVIHEVDCDVLVVNPGI